jgi:hypothetical protein
LFINSILKVCKGIKKDKAIYMVGTKRILKN